MKITIFLKQEEGLVHLTRMVHFFRDPNHTTRKIGHLQLI